MDNLHRIHGLINDFWNVVKAYEELPLTDAVAENYVAATDKMIEEIQDNNICKLFVDIINAYSDYLERKNAESQTK